MRSVGIIAGGAIAALIGIALFGPVYNVDQGETAVVTRLGQVQDKVGSPGMNFKAPFIDSVTMFNVRTDSATIDHMTVYSQDQQKGTARVTLNYHVASDQVKVLYAKLGTSYEEIKVLSSFRQQVNDNFGTHTAQEIITGRDALGKKIAGALNSDLKPYGLEVETVQIEHIEFSPEFDAAITNLVKAEVSVRTKKQELQQEIVEAQKVDAKAKGEQDKKNREADADAYRVAQLGKVSAQSIREQGIALRENPNFTEYTLATKWNGVQPTYLGGNNTPILDLRIK